MVYKGQVFVRAIKADGRWGNVDVLDLDDESFRAFVIDMLFRSELVVGLRDEHCEGEPVTLYAKQPSAVVKDGGDATA